MTCLVLFLQLYTTVSNDQIPLNAGGKGLVQKKPHVIFPNGGARTLTWSWDTHIFCTARQGGHLGEQGKLGLDSQPRR